MKRTQKQPVHTVLMLSMAAGAVLDTGIAQAYTGPGAGLSAVGSLLALVAAVTVALIGFIWYPVKRLLRKREPEKKIGSDAVGTQADSTSNE